MGVLISLVAVAALVGLGFLGAEVSGLRSFFTFVVPWTAFAVFIVGVVAKVVRWARAPVPFRITTVSGQQRSLPWIRRQPLESPYTGWEAVGRMLLEILLFRSLFRNTAARVRQQRESVVYDDTKWLWAAALAFHWAMLVIVLRHLRLFLEPVPWSVRALESVDGFFEVGVPVVYITSVVFLAALSYLLLRRFADLRVRYISQAADYFPLLLLLGIGVSGVLMRHVYKVDLAEVKTLVAGWLTFTPVAAAGMGAIFFVHLLLVSALLAYLPFSKLLHAPGVFLSPTRNLANNNRARRHVNPWDHPVEVHTYAEWEEEFRDKLKAAGFALDGE